MRQKNSPQPSLFIVPKCNNQPTANVHELHEYVGTI